MKKNTDKLLNNNKFLEVKLSDGLTNLEELTRSLAENSDFTTFDILSITRVDDGNSYTRRFSHQKIDTQAFRISAEAAQFVKNAIRKFKVN